MILDGLLHFTGNGITGSPNIGDNNFGDVITTAGASPNSSNVLDLGITSGIPTSASGGGARDIGIGDDPAMKLLIMCTTTFTGGTSLQISLQGAIDNGAGAPAAFSSWWSTPVYALATLTQGARLMDMDMPRPPDGIAIPRFLRLLYTIVGTFTTSTLRGTMVLDRHDQVYQGTNNAVLGGYPPGVNVAN